MMLIPCRGWSGLSSIVTVSAPGLCKMHTWWLAGSVLGRSLVFSASVAITEIYTHGITFPFSRLVLWGLSVIYSV